MARQDRRIKIGKTEVDGLACPAGRKDRLVFDRELTGFAVRVTADGTKTFILQYRRGAAVRRLSLGRYGDVTADQARKLARIALGEVAAGRDPVADRRATLEAEAGEAARRREDRKELKFTLEHLIGEWEARQLVHRSERYRREAPRALRQALATQLAKPAAALSAETAQRALDAIPDATTRRSDPAATGAPALRGEAMARRTRAYGHAMFAWAVGRRLVAGNPFASVAVESGEVSRDRVLSAAEIGAVWRAAGTLGWPWGPFFRFLLLTLQRAAETAGLRWAELAPDFATWQLPAARTKNRRAHIVHLAEPARAILRELRDAAPPPAGVAEGMRVARIPSPSGPFVFSTTGGTPISGFSHAKRRLDAAIAAATGESGADSPAAAPWRLHDFRRTGVTVLAGLRVPWEVADKLLNHAHGAIKGVAAVYQRHDFLAERQAALDEWAAFVLRAAQDE